MGGGGAPICHTGRTYRTTLRELDEAIRLNPDYSDAYAYRGEIYIWLKERERGIADARRALQINPGNDYARNVLRSAGVR